MQSIILEIINQFGYIGIFLLITIENIFPPIPSEIILTFGGFLTTLSSMNVLGVIAASTAGSVFGALILYAFGRGVNAERLESLFGSKLGRNLRLEREDVRRAEKWFRKHGSAATFICRFIPIIRSLISIPAGMARMRMKIFLPLTIIGTLIWNTVLIFLGRMAGATWEAIASYFDMYSTAAAAVIAATSVLLGMTFIKQRFLQKGDRR